LRYVTFALSFSPHLLEDVEAALAMGGFVHWSVPLELDAEDEPQPDVPAHTTGRIDLHAPVIEAEEAARGMEVALSRLPVTLLRSEQDEEDWAEGWKQYWKVQRLGSRIVVRPTWEHYQAQPGDLVLDLDPRQAFGTGTHATTRLALALLEEHLQEGEAVYDVGCGTGLLALAALKLGASRAWGVDNDSVAVETALENLARNGEDARFEAERADVPLPRPADVVVANILADVLIGMADALVATTGRVLILSGIIRRRIPDVEAAFVVRGLVRLGNSVEDDWEALIMGWPEPRGS